jgi:iron complex transport system ATP-binding protein
VRGEAVLSLDDASFSYGGPRVLEGLYLHVGPGETVAVLGPNGSGKTTLLRLGCGTLRPTSGTVRLAGMDPARMAPKERARMVAVVPQDNPLLFEFSAHEVVLMGRSPHLGILGLDGPADRAIVEQAMEITEVAALGERPFRTLSGGERQRVIIARALAQQPCVLLLDEPTAFLDLRHQLGVYQVLERLSREAGLAMVVASHDLNLAARFCRRMVLLSRGRIAADGAPHDVLRPDILRDVYGVTAAVREDPTTGRPFVVPLHPWQGEGTGTA